MHRSFPSPEDEPHNERLPLRLTSLVESGLPVGFVLGQTVDKTQASS